MKRKVIITGIIVALLSINSYGQVKTPEISGNNSKMKLSYSEKIEILKMMNFRSVKSDDSSDIDQETVFRILGIASLAGFFASITLFNAEIFDTVPVSLLIAGIVFFVMGN